MLNLTIEDFEPRVRAGYVIDDVDQLIEFAEDSLQTPSDSAWFDDELFNTHTMLFATPDISLTDDYTAEWSNYRTALSLLSEAYPDDVAEATFGHWTYSKFYAVKVRVHRDGVITPAFAEAYGLVKSLEDYGLIDEDDWSELEREIADQHVTEWAQDNNVAPELVQQAMSELDINYCLHDGWDGDESKVLDKARELGNTWQAHYYSGETHYPEHCAYCADTLMEVAS